MMVGRKIEVKGIVQGVGFRPFIFNLAKQYDLLGWVKNTSNGVIIKVDGTKANIDSFLLHIHQSPPPLAHIDSVNTVDIPPNGFTDFEIILSEAIPGAFVPISPDMSICADCRAELFDPKDPRYRYPFINCTNCGPRFTIVKDIPYDRPLTTMAVFPMCNYCKNEYDDPSNRRFHAQPVACPNCGPQVWLEKDGEKIAERDEAIQHTRELIAEGKIVAIKGLGGFHLACDATNDKAVQTLRDRKRRSEKPFAVMVFDRESAKQYALLSATDLDLLDSKEKPILLAKKHPKSSLSDQVAPGNNKIGIMIAYTPLHLLLLEPDSGYPDVLVMTSANISEEPIAYTNSDAYSRLVDIADAFLLHDREIHMRTDDSVIASFQGSPYFSRRARGFAPQPIAIPSEAPMILAAGAELKNTFCLSKDRYAFLSHHIGDLENEETLLSYEEAISHYENIFRVNPTAIVCDLHPDYLSSRYAAQRACKEKIPLLQVQHHHAHLAACLADNQWDKKDPVIGVIFDGTGLGTDNTIWGGEFLIGNYAGFERATHLQYTPQPGGDAAARVPARMALAHLKQAGIAWDDPLAPVQHFANEERSILDKQIEKQINTPLTSSMGRLFDAVSALLGIRQAVNYEAQAAIELESACSSDEAGFYPLAFNDKIIDPKPLWVAMLEDLRAGVPTDILSARFHNSISKMVLNVVRSISAASGIRTVALSGGVWQNMYLLSHTVPLLQRDGFDVLWHQHVPTNDGGIALGQLMIAIQSFKKE